MRYQNPNLKVEHRVRCLNKNEDGERRRRSLGAKNGTKAAKRREFRAESVENGAINGFEGSVLAILMGDQPMK